MAHQSFLPGNDLFAATAAPDGRYGAFFDDDGQSAYFYALDLDSDDLILDAIHVYDAAAPSESQAPFVPLHHLVARRAQMRIAPR